MARYALVYKPRNEVVLIQDTDVVSAETLETHDIVQVPEDVQVGMFRMADNSFRVDRDDSGRFGYPPGSEPVAGRPKEYAKDAVEAHDREAAERRRTPTIPDGNRVNAEKEHSPEHAKHESSRLIPAKSGAGPEPTDAGLAYRGTEPAKASTIEARMPANASATDKPKPANPGQGTPPQPSKPRPR